jgi:hypothetical protein
LRACDEGVLFFPVYTLHFAQSGLSAAQISSLFVVWSAVTFVLEVPSGAWADAFSRRRLLALAAASRALAFVVWAAWPTYQGFALGFVLWAFRSATSSGTKEALLYDELAATGAADRYTAITARAATIAMISMMTATVLAAPVLAWGGFGLIAAGSVLACLGSAAAALAMPERPRVRVAGERGTAAYLGALRSGLAEVRHDRRVWHAVLIAAAVPAVAALDEYVPLLVRDLGVVATGVPLVLAVLIAAMAAGSLLAERWHRATPGRIGIGICVAGLLLAAGSVTGSAAGLVPIAVCFGLLQLTRVLTEARLQAAMSGTARATVLSVAGFGSEIGAIAVYGGFGLGSLWLGLPALVAWFGLPIVVIGLLARRWLPPKDVLAGTPQPSPRLAADVSPDWPKERSDDAVR